VHSSYDEAVVCALYAYLFLIAFLILVFSANIYAALNRVDMGGHEMGPMYLLARPPLQLLLIGWAYWFAVRRRPRGGGGWA